MNEQMKRLYQVARERKGLHTPAEVARYLNQFQQTLKNWESRGISQKGLHLASEKLGVSAAWLAEGVETQARPARPSQQRGYDREILRETVLGLERGIKRRGLNPAPEKRAEAVVLLYEHYSANGTGDQNDIIETVLRLVG
ncbi:hypothetical protein R77567_01641 [Ralstonia sp. LMG 32965]|uniref:Uncharacterized protein n=1 Tax=Ralstonia flatus TaxID=3058601 RepID=A0AAD2BWC3_9RALS|nr:hypothetical protein [Ralstonia sp. LMG 32965]MBN6211455.1 hypothetical protein [Ralstonia pickettii]CAJ0862360.1 hypothetical protein R77567_01641 [Ralstonia sp. LMG 32965]